MKKHRLMNLVAEFAKLKIQHLQISEVWQGKRLQNPHPKPKETLAQHTAKTEEVARKEGVLQRLQAWQSETKKHPAVLMLLHRLEQFSLPRAQTKKQAKLQH